MSRGGGCLIAVKIGLSSLRIREWELSKEDLWISIVHENGSKTNLNVKYVENDSNLQSYLVHFDKISDIITNANTNDSFLLMGDYNLGGSVEWSIDIYRAVIKDQKVIDKRIPHELFNVQSLCGLNKFNLIRNGLNRTFDLVLSDIDQNKIRIE